MRGIAAAFVTRGLCALHVEQFSDLRWIARFEILPQHDEPETTISAMLHAVDALDEPRAEVWRQCSVREFNIGYSSGTHPKALEQRLSNALLSRIANCGATVGITIYRIDPIGER